MNPETLQLISLWVHVPLATAWVGLVILDVFAAAAPQLTPAQRGQLIGWSRWMTPAAVILLVATGVFQTMGNPVQTVASLDDLTRLRERTAYGQALFWKHGFVLVTFLLTVVVRFLLAPRLALLPAASGPGSPRRSGLEIQVLWVSVANLVACFAAIILATRMIFALH